jgi:hypothetical protein
VYEAFERRVRRVELGWLLNRPAVSGQARKSLSAQSCPPTVRDIQRTRVPSNEGANHPRMTRRQNSRKVSATVEGLFTTEPKPRKKNQVKRTKRFSVLTEKKRNATPRVRRQPRQNAQQEPGRKMAGRVRLAEEPSQVRRRAENAQRIEDAQTANNRRRTEIHGVNPPK